MSTEDSRREQPITESKDEACPGESEARQNSPDSLPHPELLRNMRRQTRRYNARRTALNLVLAPRLAAEAELLRQSADAVQQSWPRDAYHLEQVLWPFFSAYATTVFDQIAEARLQEMGSGSLVRR